MNGWARRLVKDVRTPGGLLKPSDGAVAGQSFGLLLCIVLNEIVLRSRTVVEPRVKASIVCLLVWAGGGLSVLRGVLCAVRL